MNQHEPITVHSFLITVIGLGADMWPRQSQSVSYLAFFKETYLEKIDFFFLLWVSSWRYESGDCRSIFACPTLLEFKLALALQNGHFLHNFTWMLQNLPEGYEAYTIWKKVGHPGSTILEALLQDSVLLLLRAETPLRTGCQSLSTPFCCLQWSFIPSPFRTHLTWPSAAIFASVSNLLFTLHGACSGSLNLTMSLAAKSKGEHLRKKALAPQVSLQGPPKFGFWPYSSLISHHYS